MIQISPCCIKCIIITLCLVTLLLGTVGCIFCKTIQNGTSTRFKAYVLLLILTTIFVVCNWDKSVNMEFFASFNGYNIIFLCWLVLILLSVFDVKFMGINSLDFNTEASSVQNDNTNLRSELIQEPVNDNLGGITEETNV